MVEQKQKKNLIQQVKDFWSGKINLGPSFWVVFMIGGTIVTIPSFIATDEYIDTLGSFGLVTLIIYFLFQYSYLIIAYVGTWRSASNYKPKSNQWPWGTIAKIYIALNAIRAIVVLFN